jgi:lipopolysaccharide transport system ATP-binding protein
VLDCYNALIAEREHERLALEAENGDEFAMRSGNGKANILKVELGSSGQTRRLFRVGEPATLSIRFRVNEPLPGLTAGFMFKDRLGNEVYGSNTWYLGMNGVSLPSEPGEYGLKLQIPALNVGTGSYSISVALHHASDHVAGNYDWWDRCEVFEVVPNGGPVFVGVAALEVHAMLDNEANEHVNVQE